MITGVCDDSGVVSTADVYDGVARVAQALASGTRMKMLELLAQRERAVQELAASAGLNVTTASAHLQVLREAGLVTSRRDGRQIFYRLSGDDVAALTVELARVAERHRAGVRADLAAALPVDGVRLMSRAELIAATKAGGVVVLDVRPSDEYEAGHLKGAVSIPLDELAERLSEIPPDAEVVAYCRGRYCVLSHEAVRLLGRHGLSASLAADGIAEWVGEGVKLRRGTAP
jgi:DNA-binding transcriptional ArsR family regulator/rhodanese-related sulfurtransferase